MNAGKKKFKAHSEDLVTVSMPVLLMSVTNTMSDGKTEEKDRSNEVKMLGHMQHMS